MRWCVACAVLLAGLFAGLSSAQSDELAALQAQINYGRAFQDYAPSKPTGPTVVADGAPRIAIRFDDARAGNDSSNPVKSQMAAFLRRGLSLTMSVNTESIGSGNNMTWQDIRDLQDLARDNGAVLHIAQHTNGNLAGLGDVDGDYPDAGYDITYADLVSELDPSTIIRETGYRPRAIVVPGDAGRMDWYKRNLRTWRTVADSLGLWYTQPIKEVADSTGAHVLTPMQEFAIENRTNEITGGGGTVRFNTAIARPGWFSDRHRITSATIDLGNSIVERVASWPSQYDSVKYTAPAEHYLYGGEPLTRVIPPTHDGWTIASKGGTANSDDVYEQTWAYLYSHMLALNAGAVFAMHDSASTETPTVSGITGSEWDGYFSPDHVAWTLAMLVEAGLIEVVGIEEYCEWVLGEYGDGVDLIDNPNAVIPQFAIGDTLGGTSEYPFVKGWGGEGLDGTGQTTSFALGSFTTEQTGGVAKYDRSANPNPYDWVGAAVPGPHGRSGGAWLVKEADGSGMSTISFVFGGLTPGRLRLEMGWLGNSDVATLTLNHAHLAAQITRIDLLETMGAGLATVYSDTILAQQWIEEARVIDDKPGTYDGRWIDFSLTFDVPRELHGDFSTTDFFSDAERVGAAAGWWLTRPSYALVLRFAVSDFTGADVARIGPPSLFYERHR